jgi:hypothetical protein
MVRARRECLTAFCATLALPSGVFGPVDFLALARLAAICFGVAIRGYGDAWAGFLTGSKMGSG